MRGITSQNPKSQLKILTLLARQTLSLSKITYLYLKPSYRGSRSWCRVARKFRSSRKDIISSLFMMRGNTHSRRTRSSTISIRVRAFFRKKTLYITSRCRTAPNIGPWRKTIGWWLKSGRIRYLRPNSESLGSCFKNELSSCSIFSNPERLNFTDRLFLKK